MENKKNINSASLDAQITLLDELIQERRSRFTSLNDAMKMVEGYSIGIKEATNKLDEHIKQQKKDLLDVLIKQQINQEAYRFVENILNVTSNVNKGIIDDGGKIVFMRQQEIMSLKQEIEKLFEVKSSKEKELNELKIQELLEKKRSERQHRPDQDPTTKVGQTAMELKVKRKKAKPSLS